MRLLIADQDEQYAAMLMRSIRQSDYKDKMIVSMRTDLVEDERAVFEQYDVMLLAESIYRQLDIKSSSAYVMILSEDTVMRETDPGDKKDSTPLIFKYQPVNSLLVELMKSFEHHSGMMSKRRRTGESECRIVGVYAASGGIGKTTTAVGLAELLATTGYRVFYLNMESIPSPLHAQVRESPKFCRILYQLKKGETDGLRTIWFRHIERGFDTFPLPEHDQEWAEFRGDDMRDLLGRIRDIGQHDYIVLDLDSVLTERAIFAIEACSDLLWLIRDDEDGRFKAAFVDRILRARLPEHLTRVVKPVLLSMTEQPRKATDYLHYMDLLGVEVKVSGE